MDRPYKGLPVDMYSVAPASSRPVCLQVQQQDASFCVTGTRPPSMGGGCIQSALGGSGPICLSTSSHFRQTAGDVAGLSCKRIILIAPVWSNMTCFWDLVTMSSQIPLCLPNLLNLLTQILHRNLSNMNLYALLLEPYLSRSRASLRQWQHKLRNRVSSRSVYETKWTIFTKWCHSNQMDFSVPHIKYIADFLLYLFQDKKLQPSTIDGYRSAIADKLGNTDRPKGRRGNHF